MGTYLDGADRGQVCLIATGTYTGDGGVAQAITGIGFAPKVAVVTDRQAAGGAARMFQKWDVMLADLCTNWSWFCDVEADHLISLDADGFTVDDDAGDSHPNKSGQVYLYYCLG